MNVERGLSDSSVSSPIKSAMPPAVNPLSCISAEVIRDFLAIDSTLPNDQRLTEFLLRVKDSINSDPSLNIAKNVSEPINIDVPKDGANNPEDVHSDTASSPRTQQSSVVHSSHSESHSDSGLVNPPRTPPLPLQPATTDAAPKEPHVMAGPAAKRIKDEVKTEAESAVQEDIEMNASLMADQSLLKQNDETMAEGDSTLTSTEKDTSFMESQLSIRTTVEETTAENGGGSNQKIYKGAGFASFADFQVTFEEWKRLYHHPFRVASSETFKDTDESMVERFRYRYIVYQCAHYGEPRKRGKLLGSGRRPKQNYLPCGCTAKLRLNYQPNQPLNKMVITTLRAEHNHDPSQATTVLKSPKVRKLSPNDSQESSEPSPNSISSAATFSPVESAISRGQNSSGVFVFSPVNNKAGSTSTSSSEGNHNNFFSPGGQHRQQTASSASSLGQKRPLTNSQQQQNNNDQFASLAHHLLKNGAGGDSFGGFLPTSSPFQFPIPSPVPLQKAQQQQHLQQNGNGNALADLIANIQHQQQISQQQSCMKALLSNMNLKDEGNGQPGSDGGHFASMAPAIAAALRQPEHQQQHQQTSNYGQQLLQGLLLGSAGCSQQLHNNNAQQMASTLLGLLSPTQPQHNKLHNSKFPSATSNYQLSSGGSTQQSMLPQFGDFLNQQFQQCQQMLLERATNPSLNMNLLNNAKPQIHLQNSAFYPLNAHNNSNNELMMLQVMKEASTLLKTLVDQIRHSEDIKGYLNNLRQFLADSNVHTS